MTQGELTVLVERMKVVVSNTCERDVYLSCMPAWNDGEQTHPATITIDGDLTLRALVAIGKLCEDGIAP